MQTIVEEGKSDESLLVPRSVGREPVGLSPLVWEWPFLSPLLSGA